jgi:hypothetical protein
MLTVRQLTFLLYRQVSFDLLGTVLSGVVCPGPRSAYMRADKLSFMEEITDEQMKEYTPSQLLAILRQREHVSIWLPEKYLVCWAN